MRASGAHLTMEDSKLRDRFDPVTNSNVFSQSKDDFLEIICIMDIGVQNTAVLFQDAIRITFDFWVEMPLGPAKK